jgi:hypothetical protein
LRFLTEVYLPYFSNDLSANILYEQISKRYLNQFSNISGSFEYIGLSIFSKWVTILESEEDDFKSEFARNSNPKGFNDTRSKRNYSEGVRAIL